MKNETEFKMGDVVKLKSGGPDMTVREVRDDGLYLCCWFVRQHLEMLAFPRETLELIQKISNQKK